MLSKNEVKYIQSLCHKRQRNADEVFVAEGPKLVQELLLAKVDIVQIYGMKHWIEMQQTPSINVTEITETELEKISQLQTPNQVVLIARQQLPANEPEIKNQCILALDGIQDPGNLGTILRIADWFGIKQVVCSLDCVDFYNSKVVQSTMGSISRVACWYKNLHKWLAGIEVPVYGALLNGKNVYNVEKIKEGVLVIGNEAKGIRSDILPFITYPVTIPKNGGAESLNAAIATGIILSHLVRENSQ
ncbi:MAG: RNA methyltransferase [Chitinophagaceae bacterium]|nr:RNA methyltransferase [Chitinophagaceae bacterium]